MEERRRFTRFSRHLKAQYLLEGGKKEWGKCTVIDVSRKGMGIIFHTGERINVDTIIHLEVSVPTALESINVRGMLKWLERRETDFVGGIELTEILSDVKFAKLG